MRVDYVCEKNHYFNFFLTEQNKFPCNKNKNHVGGKPSKPDQSRFENTRKLRDAESRRETQFFAYISLHLHFLLPTQFLAFYSSLCFVLALQAQTVRKIEVNFFT